MCSLRLRRFARIHIFNKHKVHVTTFEELLLTVLIVTSLQVKFDNGTSYVWLYVQIEQSFVAHS